MIKTFSFIILFCFCKNTGFSQTRPDSNTVASGIYERINKTMTDFKLDTSICPSDKIKSKILELRNLRGEFNINEVVRFKIEEDRTKNEVSKEEINKLSEFFNSGKGKRWLDNAVIWIYRRHFTYKELKQLVKFYKTSGGRKMSTEYPLIIVESLKTAELLKDIYISQGAR